MSKTNNKMHSIAGEDFFRNERKLINTYSVLDQLAIQLKKIWDKWRVALPTIKQSNELFDDLNNIFLDMEEKMKDTTE